MGEKATQTWIETADIWIGGLVMLKTVLVATDGSSYAERAVDLASNLAAKCGSRLVVLHVLLEQIPEELRHMARAEHLVTAAPAGPSVVSGAHSALAVADTGVRLEAQDKARVANAIAQQIVTAAMVHAHDNGATQVDTLIQGGDPAQRILETAKREKVDLIVMGRRGLSDLEGLLMGSVSHKVSHLADCACLTVK